MVFHQNQALRVNILKSKYGAEKFGRGEIPSEASI